MSEVVLLWDLDLPKLMSLKRCKLALRQTLFFSFCSVGKIGIGA